MKLQDLYLVEMPIRAGNLRDMSDTYADTMQKYFDENKSDFKHIGDIDLFSVMSNGKYYMIVNDDLIIAICSIDKVPTYGFIIDDVWVDKKNAGKQLFSKLLWFLHSREKMNPIYFGNTHSEETFNLLKSGGFSKFKKTWVNDFEGKEIPFEKDSIDDFYTSSKWKLKLESTKDLNDILEDVANSRFYIDGYIKCAYDWQLEQI